MDARWEKAMDFYARSGLHVEIYNSTVPTYCAQDVPFLIEQAKEVGGPVLELASGTGRAAWPMGEAGFEVVGVDLNQSMIEAAEAKRSGYPTPVSDRVRFVQGNMTGFELDRRFRFAYITFHSFQALLTPENQQSCLRSIWRHLEPGGRLVLDIFDPCLAKCDPDSGLPCDEHHTRNPVTGLDVHVKAIDRENDPVSQTFRMLWSFREVDAEGRIVREDYERLELRWTYRYEMRYLLERCGFEVLAEYSDFDRSPPAYAKKQVWVAQKKGPA